MPLEGLQSLESLPVTTAGLQSRRAPEQVPGLKFLDLNKNPPSGWGPGDFANMLHLKELGLNNMEELVLSTQIALVNLPELTKLDITNNPRLSFIHPRAFRHLPQMETLMLNNNALSAQHQQTWSPCPTCRRWVSMATHPLRLCHPPLTPPAPASAPSSSPVHASAEPPTFSAPSAGGGLPGDDGPLPAPHLPPAASPAPPGGQRRQPAAALPGAGRAPEPEIYWVTPAGLG